MKFTKMQALGNDYVYVNCDEEKISDRRSLARFVSDRNFGVGSDGLICISKSDQADFEMDMYNADGSQSQMCGNGIRAVGKYVYDYGLTMKTKITVISGGAVKYLTLFPENGKVKSVCVDMGAPIFTPQEIPMIAGGENYVNQSLEILDETYWITCLSMGNPHAVCFLEEIEALDLETIGPLFETNPLFPERVNTEFIEVIDRHTLKMRVWERGSGETMACGTGACAAVVAAVENRLCEPKVRVELLGGALEIFWDKHASGNVFMTGPAKTVFDGVLHTEA